MRRRGKSPKAVQYERIFRMKRELQKEDKRLEQSLMHSHNQMEKQSSEIRSKVTVEEKTRREAASDLQRVSEFPCQEYAELKPRMLSVRELYDFAHGRVINIRIPASIAINRKGECCLLRSDEGGWVMTETRFELSELGDNIRNHLEDQSAGQLAEDPRYVLKVEEPVTDTNLCIAYSSRYSLIEDVRKLIGSTEILIQRFIVGRKERPAIYRVDMDRHNQAKVFKMSRRDAIIEGRAGLTRSVSFKKLSQQSDALLKLSIKEDQLSRHTVSSMFPGERRAKRVGGSIVPLIEKEARRIKEYYEKYALKGKKMGRAVIDFLPEHSGTLYFLQIKHYELGSGSSCDSRKLACRLKIAKGLNLCEQKCEGIFCSLDLTSGPMMQLVSELMSEGHLSKKWAVAGIYTVSKKLISDYSSDLAIYSQNGCENVLGPIVMAQRSAATTLGKAVASSDAESEFEPQHVCELCNRIYKLYSNKKEMLLDGDSRLLKQLELLAAKPLNKYTLEDIRFILRTFGHALPLIKNLTTPRVARKTNYYFGYRTILEAQLRPQLQPQARVKELKPLTNYVSENIRSLSQSHRHTRKFVFEKHNECLLFPKVASHLDVLEKYRAAELSQRNLIQRLRASILT